MKFVVVVVAFVLMCRNSEMLPMDNKHLMTVFERNSGFKNNIVIQHRINYITVQKKKRKMTIYKVLGDFHMFMEKRRALTQSFDMHYFS